jgi:Protein of unknown function (DUF3040)
VGYHSAQEVEVPLSENEQRLLEQMERALYAEDPKFASTMRGAARRSGALRRMVVGLGGILLGLGLLIGAVAFKIIPLGVFGFLCMLAGTAYALSTQRRSGPTGVVGQPPAARSKRGSRRSATFMQRLEQRWDRRRDQY